MFNKLQDQKQTEWTKTLTLFIFSCFVVWWTMSDDFCKERVVVNIRALNKIIMSDAYFVSFQADILVTIYRVKFIITVNCTSFFYQ